VVLFGEPFAVAAENDLDPWRHTLEQRLNQVETEAEAALQPGRHR
jgi:hypothetical protein